MYHHDMRITLPTAKMRLLTVFVAADPKTNPELVDYRFASTADVVATVLR